MIKTIIFDFGDVFINLDQSATERELLKLGVPEITNAMFFYITQYEKGLINTEQLTRYFCSQFEGLSTLDITKAWNAMILDFPEHRLQFIETLSLKKEYKLILLSNTNALHITKVKENMGLKRYIRFQNCFNKFYLSHEIHFRKPDRDIYEFVLSENNLVAEECLFIDDSLENIESASKLGIHTWNNNPMREDIVDLFRIKKHLF